MCKSYHLCSISNSHCRCYLVRKTVGTIAIWQGRLYAGKYYCQLARKAVGMLLTLLLKSPYEYLGLKSRRQCRTNFFSNFPYVRQSYSRICIIFLYTSIWKRCSIAAPRGWYQKQGEGNPGPNSFLWGFSRNKMTFHFCCFLLSQTHRKFISFFNLTKSPLWGESAQLSFLYKQPLFVAKSAPILNHIPSNIIG